MPFLSILVPTLTTRRAYAQRLHDCLAPQLGKSCEIVWLRDNGEATIGAKRNRLVHSVRSPYLTFIDDDDAVPHDYCRRVLDAFLTGADIITFNFVRDDDGAFAERQVRRLDGIPPVHLCPIRTEFAQAIGFKNMNDGEDAEYSKRLRFHFPSLREHYIDDDLYFYHRRHDRTGEVVNVA